MFNAGQSCCSVERIYVQKEVYDEFVEEYVKTVKSFKMGDPMDNATYLGPLTRGSQVTPPEAHRACCVLSANTIPSTSSAAELPRGAGQGCRG
jgi:delta 1-pyrroline-5-carboxylate dehydrogenase